MLEFLFVSDIHGRSKELENQLNEIISQKQIPKIVFFLGDIVGSDIFGNPEWLFYEIVNPIDKILEKNPNITDIEILNCFVGHNETIGDISQKIWESIHGQNEKKILNIQEKIDVVNKVIKYQSFEHFASSSSAFFRRKSIETMQENAKIWINIMNQFVELGSTVVVIEGDSDLTTPIDFYQSEDTYKKLPPQERKFYLKKEIKLANNQILYFDKPDIFETEKIIFVLWPFEASINITEIPNIENQENKKIVLVSHSQIDWYKIMKDIPMSDNGSHDEKYIQKNMPITFFELGADAAVHGHLHNDRKTNCYYVDEKPVHYLPKRTLRFIDF